MAALYPDTHNRRILVKNLPPVATVDKLTIYFQRKQHGGRGDVTSVTYPKSKSEADQAIVEFEESKTMESVLRYSPHIMNDQHLDVTEFPEQALGHTSVIVSERVRSKLSQIPNASSKFEESTGVKIAAVNNSLSLSGQWYQVLAAADMIDVMINGTTTSQTSAQLQKTSGHGNVDLPQDGARGSTVKDSVESSTEVKVDINAYLFFKKHNPNFIPTFMKKYKVLITEDESKLVFRAKKSGTAAKSDIETIANDFNQRYSKFADSVRREYIDVKNLPGSPPQDEIDKAVKEVMDLNKNIFIFEEKRDNNKNHLVFLALSKRDCENIVDEFQCFFLKNKKLSSLTLDRTSTKVVIVHGNFRKEASGALISEIDRSKTGMVVSAGGESVNKAVKKASSGKPYFHAIDHSDGRCNLQCQSIIHYMLDPLDSEIDFENSITSCLEFANKLALRTISLPMNCLGAELDEKTVRKSILNAISQFASTSDISRSKLLLSEIRIIHSDETEARKLVKCFSGLTTAPPSEETSSATKKNSKRKSLTKTKDEDDKEECPICLDDLSGAMAIKTLPCKHTFHQDCIQRALKVSNKCPMCKKVYGTVTGNMPIGTMNSTAIRTKLPGFHCDTIVIDYNIPSGIQGPEHPNPGRRFSGANRVAYLPNNKEGRELLLLLKKAFDARLTFTVGRSVTTGVDNTVTWNDIHHKTSIHGGSTGFGYPDPGYLGRLRQELADKGITN